MSTVLEELPEAVAEAAPPLNNNLKTFFNSVTLKFHVPVSGHVTMKVFDIMGREMTTLISEHREAGSYHVTWDAKDAVSGAYWYSLQAKSFIDASKFNLVK